jgi:glyoxylase-like metal-dependent hydrolase (beta-lactamase superfamily II)
MLGSLAYVLAYAIEGADGIFLVDAGMDDPRHLENLQRGLATFGAALEDVKGILFTHFHRDHYGLSALLRQTTNAWFAMHEIDAVELLERRKRHGEHQIEGWLEAVGVPASEREPFVAFYKRSGTLSVLPRPDRMLRNGEVVALNGWQLRVVHTPGHSPGHICLFEDSRKVAFTGDCVLAETTPNISILAGEIGDPLSDYLASLVMLERFRSVLSLPGHECRVPIAKRASEILSHHAEQLRQAQAALDRGAETVREVAELMPWNRSWFELDTGDRYMALGETYAHLVTLVQRGVIRALPGPSRRPQTWSKAHASTDDGSSYCETPPSHSDATTFVVDRGSK